jgi:preprotein translocase subunit YajC
VHHFILTLADGAASGGAGGAGAPIGGCAGGGSFSSMIPLVLMFVIFYFMLIRPQQKKAKDHQNFLSGLKRGDQVVTRGGVIGRITGVTDNVVTMEIQEKVRIRVLKSFIEGAHKEGTAAVTTAAPAADKADKADKAEKAEKKEKDASPPAAT